ncbi:8764_t:CDS:2 [Cetraspora pellucida]|uniref:8764_t:CDS:1 n=1 Tax=Cetraspora pellucida TaxID=1433469 RepID=A0A9N9IMM5_9GLOM|nr:8764_t:CDS:2 [Cetraspora pellucida]
MFQSSNNSDNQNSNISIDVCLIKKTNLTWFRENEKPNFRRPIMYSDDNEHITEYTQIKLSDKQNALLNKDQRPFLKKHEFVLDKDQNIVDKISREYLLELLYSEVKLSNIRFKNKCSFDLCRCDNEVLDIFLKYALKKYLELRKQKYRFNTCSCCRKIELVFVKKTNLFIKETINHCDVYNSSFTNQVKEDFKMRFLDHDYLSKFFNHYGISRK